MFFGASERLLGDHQLWCVKAPQRTQVGVPPPPLLNTMHALHDLEKINCIGDKSVDVLARILDISNALFIGCRPTHNKSASFDPAR
jgi:hypothetical protein